MESKIVFLSPMKLACMEHVGDYWMLARLWGPFVRSFAASGLGDQNAQFMTVYPDHWDSVPMEKRHSYAAATISQNGFRERNADIGRSGLKELSVSGGLYAVAAYFGPGAGIDEAWDRWRREWLSRSGWMLDMTRPALEWYRGDSTVLPAELHLELLCDPIEKA